MIFYVIRDGEKILAKKENKENANGKTYITFVDCFLKLTEKTIPVFFSIFEEAQSVSNYYSGTTVEEVEFKFLNEENKKKINE
jgi:hypothetical protein